LLERVEPFFEQMIDRRFNMSILRAAIK